MRIHRLLILLAASIALIACGGGGGGGMTAESGTVALFVTDNLSDFDQVITTITGVEILHTGPGTSCALLSEPVTLDIAELASELLLLDLTSCPAGQYDRIRVETSNAVTLAMGDTSSECTFTSYKDNENKPNVLHCSGDTCFMEINGRVNVMVSQNSTLTLDFDLKEFEVEGFGEPECTVTMKVEPLNANDVDDKKDKGSRESIKGVVSALDTTGKTFILTKKGEEFTVSYGDVTQEGVDELLMLAEDNQLKTKVRCSEFDLEAGECTASEVYVEVEGTVSGITDTTFMLTFNPEISVDYSGAEVEGTLLEGAEAEVKLSGYNGTDYIADEVEVDDEEEDEDDGEKEDADEEDEDKVKKDKGRD
jgi:hypothetical protein